MVPIWVVVNRLIQVFSNNCGCVADKTNSFADFWVEIAQATRERSAELDRNRPF
jgi:hypothetical protein